jgi:hypothetical protein
MNELIARLEKAAYPDHEIDVAIHSALGVPTRQFTASIDAALTLVPEGCVWTVMTDYELPGRAHINYSIPIADERLRPPANFNADAATPAIALCIAALKARNATKMNKTSVRAD